MSLYRCIFCGGKSDYSEDFQVATEKQIKESGTVIEGSNYEWLICNECYKEKQK